MQSFEPETEFEVKPPQNQLQQQTTSTSYQAVNTLPQIKAEPDDANYHFGRDRHADGRQAHTLQHQVKVEDKGGEGQQGGCICEICGRRYGNEIHLKNHKSFRHGTDPKAKQMKLDKFPKENRPLPAAEEKWRCHRNGCDAELASKEDLQNHLVSEHNMEQEEKGVSQAGLQTTRTREQNFLEGKTAGASKARSAEERKLQIYLGKLPAEGISNEEIKQHFAQYGPVAKVTRPVDWTQNKEPRNYGFVQFHREETALQMLQQGSTTIKGHRIEIKEVRSKNKTRDLRCWLQTLRSKGQLDGTSFKDQEPGRVSPKNV